MTKKEVKGEIEKIEVSDDVNGNEKENKKNTKKSKSVLGRKKKEDKLKLEIEELKQEVGEAKDKYLRLYAEFDNFKKRTIKEKFELMNTAAQKTIVDLLPVLDDFDRAEAAGEEFTEGVKMVRNKLSASLKGKGLSEMVSTGEEFDPEFHEAITEIPLPEMKGKVVDTIEKGYTLNDKIIRFAKVVVGK